MKDLTPDQTEALVGRALKDNPEGKNAVLNILKKVFREIDSAVAKSLSGKPVIISYLLEIVEELVRNEEATENKLTEWQVYDLIIKKLMLRDYKRAPAILPEKRRHFLRELALWLSQKDYSLINQENFKALVEKYFEKDLKRISGSNYTDELDRIFADVRSSSTLTRAYTGKNEGWRFSHNSLREFLLAEYLLNLLEQGVKTDISIPISDAMRSFVSSLHVEQAQKYLELLAVHFRKESFENFSGRILNLLWDAGIKIHAAGTDPISHFLSQIVGNPVNLKNTVLDRINMYFEGKRSNLEKARSGLKIGFGLR